MCVWLCGPMVAESAALVGMCARCALGLWKCEESRLRHRRDVECACWACIAGAVSSAVSRVLYRSIAIADVCRRMCVAARVSLWLACDCAALRGIVCAVDCSCVRVSLRCVHACVIAAVQWEGGAALRVCCGWLRRSLAVRATH